ncbi:hypothetical protein AAFC00_001980 [Neodothiora populina]|uniref:Uncharacterized protein n=1 Tax=Neodothiora populina TaxID=2781224 RepID=A0ABR3PFY6_9PEZI
MSKSLNSPTARLLRSSRLFSLPPPLPAAPLEAVNSSGQLRSSDTATLPYPTHQAISTPPAARHRGDWGLKRSLPGRSMPRCNAHVRIKAIDNLNHMTDFASAADHTQTVLKWQDMNMPLSMPQKRNGMTRGSRATPVSVFEEDVDNTAFPTTAASQAGARDIDSIPISAERAIILRSLSAADSPQRWKTEGPWVNGLSEEEFQQYLAKTVRKHKPGFLKFLEQVKIDQKKSAAIAAMRDSGLISDMDPKAFAFEVEQQSQLHRHELGDLIKELRDNNNGLSSELSELVRQYFDLPAFPIVKQDSTNAFIKNLRLPAETDLANPPATHPSAGLSYLRTKAFLQNHPTFGPQASHEPVEARVIRPRSAIGAGNDRRANIGVAGFVTEESHHSNFNNSKLRNAENLSPEQRHIQKLSHLDPDTPGGNKIWVDPIKAHVDEKGLIQISVDRAADGAVGVKTGKPIEAPSLSSAPRFGFPSGRAPRLDERSPPGTRGNANYGYALPDERPARRAQAFDAAELTRAKGAVEGESREDPTKLIEQLARQHQNERKA